MKDGTAWEMMFGLVRGLWFAVGFLSATVRSLLPGLW